MGAEYFKLEPLQLKKLFSVKVFKSGTLPKAWTNVPNVNFDGKKIEQHYTQTFEERLAYKEGDQWSTNIVQIDQKTDPTPWEAIINKDGKINDIADITAARTAFGVNSNHSNDAVMIKRFHLWGKKHKIATSGVHDAFVVHAAQMVEAKDGLREIYADLINNNVIRNTLKGMRARGLPKEVYDRYLKEAIDTGLIPIPGVSRIDGKLMVIDDILTREHIQEEVPKGFFDDKAWYGMGG